MLGCLHIAFFFALRCNFGGKAAKKRVARGHQRSANSVARRAPTLMPKKGEAGSVQNKYAHRAPARV